MEESFSAFVASRGDALRRFGFVLTGSWHVGEDLVQTALTKTYLRRRFVRSADALEPYVRRTMVTTYLSWRRRKAWSEQPTAVVPDAAGADVAAGVDERDLMWSALAGLSRQQRAVLVLRYYEDLSEDEIAATLGCSVGAVKSSAARGLARLRVSESLAGSDHDTR